MQLCAKKRFCSLLAALLILLGVSSSVAAQELNCRVEINTSSLQGSNTQVFETLKEAITSYMNERKWSTAQFSTSERIECSLMIVLKEDLGSNTYSGELQVQSRRPVYNTSYSSTLLNFRDVNFQITYQEHEPLVFTETGFENNLTAILNFYAYMILGVDFDSFAPEGGSYFFQKATEQVNYAQSASEGGWQTYGDTRNRYALVTAFTDARTANYRTLWYQYHRMGLDAMTVSVDKGRAVITTNLAELTAVDKAEPTSILLPLFSDSKLDELVNIYTKASQSERDEVYELLTDLYPTQSTKLKKIKAGES